MQMRNNNRRGLFRQSLVNLVGIDDPAVFHHVDQNGHRADRFDSAEVSRKVVPSENDFITSFDS